MLNRFMVISLLIPVIIISGCGGGTSHTKECRKALKGAHANWLKSAPPTSSEWGLALSMWCLHADCLLMLNQFIEDNPQADGALAKLEKILDKCLYCYQDPSFSALMLEGISYNICDNVVDLPEPLHEIS